MENTELETLHYNRLENWKIWKKVSYRMSAFIWLESWCGNPALNYPVNIFFSNSILINTIFFY